MPNKQKDPIVKARNALQEECDRFASDAGKTLASNLKTSFTKLMKQRIKRMRYLDKNLIPPLRIEFTLPLESNDPTLNIILFKEKVLIKLVKFMLPKNTLNTSDKFFNEWANSLDIVAVKDFSLKDIIDANQLLKKIFFQIYPTPEEQQSTLDELEKMASNYKQYKALVELKTHFANQNGPAKQIQDFAKDFDEKSALFTKKNDPEGNKFSKKIVTILSYVPHIISFGAYPALLAIISRITRKSWAFYKSREELLTDKVAEGQNQIESTASKKLTKSSKTE